MKLVREPKQGRRRLAAVLYWATAVASPLVAAVSFWSKVPEELVLWIRIVAAGLAVVSLICKGLGDYWSKEREKSLKAARVDEERRISMILSDLAATLGRVAESTDSREREERSVEAAENVVVSLLEHRARQVRSCFYRLQWTDEVLLPDDDEHKNAFLQRVGSARGRGIHQPREKFTFAEDDPDGIETLRRILADRAIHESDTAPSLTGRKYGSYLGVPVHYRGDVIGMITADSPDVGGLGVDCEDLLRMVGAFAALGLETESLALEPALGRGRGALIPGILEDFFSDPTSGPDDDGGQR